MCSPGTQRAGKRPRTDNSDGFSRERSVNNLSSASTLARPVAGLGASCRWVPSPSPDPRPHPLCRAQGLRRSATWERARFTDQNCSRAAEPRPCAPKQGRQQSAVHVLEQRAGNPAPRANQKIHATREFVERAKLLCEGSVAVRPKASPSFPISDVVTLPADGHPHSTIMLARSLAGYASVWNTSQKTRGVRTLRPTKKSGVAAPRPITRLREHEPAFRERNLRQ